MVNVRAFVQLVTVATALCVASTAASASEARLLQTTDASTADGSASSTTNAPGSSLTDALSPVVDLLPAVGDALSPTPEPTTTAPTPEPTTVASTEAPVTVAPTEAPVTVAPTEAPVTVAPTEAPVTVAPTEAPVTAAPTEAPVTLLPTDLPVTLPPVTLPPVTLLPTDAPTTAPTAEPTAAPVPVPEPTTPAPPTPTSDPTPAPPTPTSDPTPAPPTPTSDPTPAPPTPTSDPTPAPPTPTSDPTPAPPTPTSSVPVPGPTTPTPTDPTTDTPAPPTGTPKPTTVAPPLVEVPVATEIPDTPAPTPTKKGQDATDTKDAEDDAQANMKDIIVASTNETASEATDSPKVNPFEIREINTDAPKPVVLDIKDDSTTTAEPKLYVRGAKTDPPATMDSTSSGTTGTGSSTSASSPSSAANVIGGSHRNTATSAEAILSSSSQAFHDFLRYATCAFAGISVALLLFFHYVSLDATLTWTSSLWSPNTWEFILYVGYLQQMGSVSQLTLLKTPYFLWDYTDSFAWTNFLIERATNSDSRRLETIVLGGVVAYGDRIGIDETKIVYHAAIGFAVVLAILLLAFLVIAVLAKRKAEQALDDPANMHSSTQGVHQLRSASIRTLGLCVLIWYFALYPLSVYASFEISMEVQAKQTVPLALLVSILSIGVVCFGVLAWCGRVIMHKSKDELLQFENIATWGSLYAEFSFRSRMFFVLGALVQIITGIIVGTMDADPTQLIIVLLIEVLYLVAVFVLSPFAEVLVLRFTYALGLLKIVNFALSFGFLNSNGMSDTGRNGVANAYIGINTIVIIAWFIRLLIVFSTYIRAWAVRSSFVEEQGLEDSTAKYETRTATDSEVYASVATARHGNNSHSSDSDDYHKAQASHNLGYL